MTTSLDVTKPGHAIVDALLQEGVDVVFGMPGGHILGIYDGLHVAAPEIRHVLVRHEHTAASMAAAYAQLTGEPGICVVTAGPGATNLVTAVAEAYIGAVPMVIFAGRGITRTTHRGASQEVPTERVFRPVTKHAVRVDRAENLLEVVHQAFVIARSGKPGPVYIDIPKDLFDQSLEPTPYQAAPRRLRTPAPAEAIRAAASELAAARRPLIVAGGGAVASGAFDALRDLAELLRAPVLTSVSGRGVLPEDHPLAAGGLGAHRNDLSKRLLLEADVILGLGTRFEEMETNWRPGFVPAEDARYLQVDIDPAEFGRSIRSHVDVCGDVRTVLEQLLGALPEAGLAPVGAFETDPRTQEVVDGIAAIDREVEEEIARNRKPLSPLQVIRTAQSVFPRETTVGVDVGCLSEHIAGAAPFFRVFEPRSFVSPSSFYGMGFVTSAIPAAKIVYPDRPALCFGGDGSFQMVLPVLPTAVENRLPVTWCILNDGALGSIRDLQEYRFDERYIATEFEYQPDLGAVARACGCYGERVTDPDEIHGAFKRALDANADGQPAVLDFRVAADRMTQSREHFNLFRPGEQR
jgi:acetolactate synthase-1/2/3 large subunit